MPEYGTQCAFKGKREHIAKVSITNISYPHPQFDIQIPHGVRYNVIVRDTRKITFNIDNELIGKTRSIVNNVSSRRGIQSETGLEACGGEKKVGATHLDFYFFKHLYILMDLNKM